MKRNLVLVALLVVVLALSLVACNHVHTYWEAWEYDELEHWHKASCEHSDEKGDLAPHSFNDKGECVCGYKVDPEDLPNHVHPYSKMWMFDETNHWHGAICKHYSEQTATARHTFVDGVCSVCGAWENFSATFLSVLSQSEVWNYYWTAENFNLGDVNEDGTNILVNKGEIKLALSKDGAISGNGSMFVTITPNEAGESDSVQASMKCVIEDGVLYAISSETGKENVYFKTDLQRLIAQGETDVIAEIQNAFEQMDYNMGEIYGYLNQAKYYLSQMGMDDIENLPDFGDIDLANGIFIGEKDDSVGGVTTYRFNFDLLRDLNKMLAETTVEQYVDGVLGEGAFNKIPDMVSYALDLTVGDFLDMLEAQGVTLDDIIKTLDTFVAAQYPDENINTLNELINYLIQQNGATLPIKVDVKQMILMLEDATVYDLLSMVGQSNNETAPTKEQIVEYVSQALDQVRDLTVYGMISEPSFDLPADKIDMSANMIKLCVDEAINILENNFQVRLRVGEDGSCKLVISVVALEQTEITDNMTAEEKAVAQIFNEYKQQLANVHGTVTVGADRILDTDYANVKQQVEEAYGKIVVPEAVEERNALEAKLEKELKAFSVQFCASDDGRLLIQVNKVQVFDLVDGTSVNINLMVMFIVDLENPVSICKNGENVYELNYSIELTKVDEYNSPYVNEVDGKPHFVDYAMENWGYSEQEAQDMLEDMRNSVVEELVMQGLNLSYNTELHQFSVIQQTPDVEATPAE